MMHAPLREGEILVSCPHCGCETPRPTNEGVRGNRPCTGRRPAYPDGPCAKVMGLEQPLLPDGALSVNMTVPRRLGDMNIVVGGPQVPHGIRVK